MRGHEVEAGAKQERQADQPAKQQQESEEWRHLDIMLDTLEPGDSKYVAQLLQQHPQFRDEIIARAQANCGNDTVAKALELLSNGQQGGAAAKADAGKTSQTVASGKQGGAQGPEVWSGLEVKMMILEPGDEKFVVMLLEQHPDLRDQIIAKAQEMCGHETVAEALRLEKSKTAPTADGAAADTATTTDAAAPTAVSETEPTPADKVAEDAVEAAPTTKSGSAGGAKSGKPESGWVVRARAYNAAHPEYVNLFLDFTGGACLDAAGNLDPNLVATWQAQNRVPPDGRVGMGTVARASLMAPILGAEGDTGVEQAGAPPADAAKQVEV